MRTVLRSIFLVAAVSSLTACAATTAGAVTWENSGDTAYTASGGPFTITTNSVSLACTGQDATGTVGVSPFVGNTWSAITGTEVGTGCTLAGVPMSLDCGTTFTATAQAGSVVTGDTDESCTLAQGSTPLCIIHGQRRRHWRNPPPNATITTTPGHLRATNAPPHTCPIAGTLRIPHQTLHIISGIGGPLPHTGPVLTRTS